MSYDTSINTRPCAHCGAEGGVTLAAVGNMTSNVGRMFAAVLPGPYEGGGRYYGTGEPEPRGGLTGLSGLTASDAVPHLVAALDAFGARETELRAMEPENGWGSYDGARAYLARLLDACRRHPTGVVAVSW